MTGHHDPAVPAHRLPKAPAGAAPTSPFYDHRFVNASESSPWHISGACQAAYARGCRCDGCRKAWTEGRRKRTGAQPSPLAQENQRLEAELDAAELHIHALQEENSMLRCRLDEVQ